MCEDLRHLNVVAMSSHVLIVTEEPRAQHYDNLSGRVSAPIVLLFHFFAMMRKVNPFSGNVHSARSRSRTLPLFPA